ncbi:DsbA family protein [Anaerolineae bacterium CFX8]|nr:DsbA family protein [Anaerolineae bacterium CFX8]
MTSTPASRRKAYRAHQQSRRISLVFVVAFVLVGVLLLVVFSNRSANVAPPVANNRLEYDPVLGNPDAPVTIIEYGAYACSACRAWHQAGIIEQILAEFPDQVRFVFRDFPVIVPAYDRMAAEIAQCALDQSQAGFWEFHDLLYTEAVPGMSQDELIVLGGRAGLDQEALRTCVASGTHRETVQYDLNRAMNLGLPGTPSFLVNGARIFNATPDVLRSAIINALG